MSKRGNKYLPIISIVFIIVIITMVIFLYKHFKKENFEEDNIQKALKLANYAGSRGINLTNKPKLKAGESYPDNLSTVQCPGGVCPGLGAGFDLRKKNINEPLQFLSGKRIFENTNIKDNKCFQFSRYQSDKPSMSYTKDTQELMHSIATANSLSASAPIEIATFSLSADVATKSDTKTQKNIQTAMLSLIDGYGSVSFLEDTDCRSNNLTSEFKDDLQSLSNFSVTNPGERGSWTNYFAFFDKWGTHVMTQIVFGSKLQYWESIINNTEDSQNILQIKACLKAQQDMSNISAGVCSGYDESDIKKANRTSTNSNADILGGGDEIRRKISNLYLNGQNASPEDITDFLKSSHESNQAIGYIFTPIWKLILQMSIGYCIDDYMKNIGEKSTQCKIMQMANNLEAAFAFDTVNCQKLTSSIDNKIYQEFREFKTDNPIKEYQCFAAKTGCTSGSKDCHYNWGFTNPGCLAYGPGALAQGNEYELNPGNYRTKIQGDEKSSDPYEGINNSCYLGSAGCACNYGWAGGLSDRSLWKSGD